MKKRVVLALALVLALSAATTSAAVPSKTTSDMTRVVALVSANGAEISGGFALTIVKGGEEIAAEIDKIIDFVVNQGGSPIDCFGDAAALAVAALLPQDFDLSALELNEFVGVMAAGYDSASGDAIATFNFITKYAQGQALVALLGLYSGEVDGEGNSIVEWVALHAEGQADGGVAITFPSDILVRLQAAPAAALAILSEPTEA